LAENLTAHTALLESPSKDGRPLQGCRDKLGTGLLDGSAPSEMRLRLLFR
jgi:hypothetical protein